MAAPAPFLDYDVAAVRDALSSVLLIVQSLPSPPSYPGCHTAASLNSVRPSLDPLLRTLEIELRIPTKFHVSDEHVHTRLARISRRLSLLTLPSFSFSSRRSGRALNQATLYFLAPSLQ